MTSACMVAHGHLPACNMFTCACGIQQGVCTATPCLTALLAAVQAAVHDPLLHGLCKLCAAGGKDAACVVGQASTRPFRPLVEVGTWEADSNLVVVRTLHSRQAGAPMRPYHCGQARLLPTKHVSFMPLGPRDEGLPLLRAQARVRGAPPGCVASWRADGSWSISRWPAVSWLLAALVAQPMMMRRPTPDAAWAKEEKRTAWLSQVEAFNDVIHQRHLSDQISSGAC
eukprot:352594-Chlamydomonas_euryale.AAC.13